jgi:hypothetical protein
MKGLASCFHLSREAESVHETDLCSPNTGSEAGQ